MREIRTELEIDASPKRVWSILVDFAAHPEWNPFILSITGELQVGAQLAIRVQPPGGKALTFKPKVLTVAQNEELRWLGRLLLPRVLDGEHIFELRALEEGVRTRFVHRERFSGILLPLFWSSLDTHTRQGFEDMNRALKQRAEA